MSERPLAGACENCPMRHKINCDQAEIVGTMKHTIPHTSEAGNTFYMEITPHDPIGYYSFELTDDIHDTDAPRLGLRTQQTELFQAAAEAAIRSARVQMAEMPQQQSTRLPDIDTLLRKEAHYRIERKAESASLQASLEQSVTECEEPIRDETDFFLSRKRCGAHVLGRVITRGDMIIRHENEARVKRDSGMAWVIPERKRLFKPIR